MTFYEIEMDPRLDAIRDNPRFKAVLEKIRKTSEF
jgi:hypothetical protein